MTDATMLASTMVASYPDALLTGAVYDDANLNGQYDPGEGIPDVTVTMDDGFCYAMTSASGGYSLPLTRADGSYADGPVTARMALPNSESRTVTMLVTAYMADGIACPYRANMSRGHNLQFDPIFRVDTTKGP